MDNHSVSTCDREDCDLCREYYLDLEADQELDRSHEDAKEDSDGQVRQGD